jgi:hypothetical protein
MLHVFCKGQKGTKASILKSPRIGRREREPLEDSNRECGQLVKTGTMKTMRFWIASGITPIGVCRDCLIHDPGRNGGVLCCVSS